MTIRELKSLILYMTYDTPFFLDHYVPNENKLSDFIKLNGGSKDIHVQLNRTHFSMTLKNKDDPKKTKVLKDISNHGALKHFFTDDFQPVIQDNTFQQSNLVLYKESGEAIKAGEKLESPID